MSDTDQRKEKEGIQRASVLLLSGWKMLAICCPLCHMALFSKDGEMRCAKCELPVKMETGSCGSHAFPDVETIDEHSESAVVESAPLLTYDEMKREYAEKRKRSDTASAKLGQKLLEGWTMMAEYCPGVECAYSPLVSRDGGLLVICPVCEVGFVQSDGGYVQQMSTRVEEKEEFLIEKHAVQKQDPSEKVAKYLLKGWKMLAESCSCGNNAPLLRDHDNKDYCIDCGYGARLSSSTTQRTKVENILVENTEDDVDDNDLSVALDRISSAAFDVMRRSQSEDVNIGKNESSKTKEGDSTVNVISLLDQRMVKAAHAIKSEDDIEAAKNQAELIVKLAEALLAVETLREKRQRM
eukprot:scaffold4845_cov159-Ochromonas_danica.AAC.1